LYASSGFVYNIIGGRYCPNRVTRLGEFPLNG
jgi:hypothetical protein